MRIYKKDIKEFEQLHPGTTLSLNMQSFFINKEKGKLFFGEMPGKGVDTGKLCIYVTQNKKTKALLCFWESDRKNFEKFLLNKKVNDQLKKILQ